MTTSASQIIRAEFHTAEEDATTFLDSGAGDGLARAAEIIALVARTQKDDDLIALPREIDLVAGPKSILTPSPTDFDFAEIAETKAPDPGVDPCGGA
jgi:hypothetical protein